MSNNNPKRQSNSNETRNERFRRRLWSHRLVVPLFLVFLIVWIPVFALLQIRNIEPPTKYVRQDYYLPLIDQYGTDFGTIIMNCFDMPLFLSALMMYRQAQVHFQALLRKDSLVCDFKYGLLNRTATITEAEVWFINMDSDFIVNRTLNVTETGEQIIFPMPYSGWYTFEVWLLPTVYVGWEEMPYRNLNLYVYASPQAYAEAQNTYNEAMASVLGSVVGSIIGVLGIVLTIMEPKSPQPSSRSNRER